MNPSFELLAMFRGSAVLQEHRPSAGASEDPETAAFIIERPRYYPAFDYLRIILATTVASGHAGLGLWKESGNFAVQIFFALSGFLIGEMLMRSTPSDLPKFYFNRAARIWIPYFIAIALLVTASSLKESITGNWLKIIFYDVTFTYNFFVPTLLSLTPLQGTGNHFWSICAEEQFYLLAPFLITLLPGQVGRKVGFWSMLSVAVLALPYWGDFGSISLGVLSAVFKSRNGEGRDHRATRLSFGVLAAASFLSIYIELVPYRIGAPISAISIVLLLARAGSPSRLGLFLGGISFPLYLNHWIGIFVANAMFRPFALQNTWLADFVGVLISILVAAILYLLIDHNVRTNRERFFTPFRGKAIGAAGIFLVTVGLLGGLWLSAASD